MRRELTSPMTHQPVMICLDTRWFAHHQQLQAALPTLRAVLRDNAEEEYAANSSMDHSPNVLDSRAYEQAVTRFLASLPHSLSHQHPDVENRRHFLRISSVSNPCCSALGPLVPLVAPASAAVALSFAAFGPLKRCTQSVVAA